MVRDGPEVRRRSVDGSIQCRSIWHSGPEGEGIFCSQLSPVSVMELPIPPAARARTRLAGA
jgi:hypothetical protein